MMTRLMSFNRFLTSRRLAYAWITGGVLWFAWLLSCILGPGNMDMAGHVVGTDYLQFYAAGVTLSTGQSLKLYNFDYQNQVEQSIAGPGLKSFHAFITPPFLAWLFVPLSAIPYIPSFISWSLLGLIFLWISIRIFSKEKPFKSFLWSLTWFPIFASISFGQNSLLSLFLFSLTYWLWIKDKRLEAGLVSSLLIYKPQMILGIGLLWLLEYRKEWKTILGFIVGAAALVGISILFTPQASKSYIFLARTFLPGLIYSEQFPLWHLHSLRGFWTLLFPGLNWLSEILSFVLSLAGILAFISFWRNNRGELKLLYAAAICLTIWITPHAMIYDWSILLIPALILWHDCSHLQKFWKPIFALIWISTLISGPLTVGQLSLLPVAVQITIPIFIVSLLVVNKLLEGNWQGEIGAI